MTGFSRAYGIEQILFTENSSTFIPWMRPIQQLKSTLVLGKQSNK
jgi:hypothetical protein